MTFTTLAIVEEMLINQRISDLKLIFELLLIFPQDDQVLIQTVEIILIAKNIN